MRRHVENGRQLIKINVLLMVKLKVCTNLMSVVVNSSFLVGHRGPHEDSSRAGCGPRAGRCAPLV